MKETNPSETSVGPVHPMHPTLTTLQVQAAHLLAELPLGMTWAEKAAKIGTTADALRRYRLVPEFMELVIQVSRVSLRAEIPGAHQAMVKGMKAGGASGARYLELFFKITGELTDQEQANSLRGWLDAVADCSSAMLLDAIQRTTGVAPSNGGAGGSRVVAPAPGVAQGGRVAITEHTPLAEIASTGSFEL